MWPDLIRGIMGNLSSYGLHDAVPNSGGYVKPVTDPQLLDDLAMANRNLARYGGAPADSAGGSVPPMSANPSIDEMIQIAQRYARKPLTRDRILPDAPPQTPADATNVVAPQGPGGPQTNMLSMLMQHLLESNPQAIGGVGNIPAGKLRSSAFDARFRYLHPQLTPGQPLPLRMR